MADNTNSTTSYYQKLVDNATSSVESSLPSAQASDDQMYRRYLDKYQQMGNTAMKDTIGQGAALTGGYNNSYAQNVGQQAYDSYIQQANDKMLDYAMQSKQLALQQNEYINNLAAAQYQRDMEAAAVGATYGNFGIYNQMFGDDFGNSMLKVWKLMNPALAGGGSTAVPSWYGRGGNSGGSSFVGVTSSSKV